MFYSRELLAHKASLGQIWLLGTKQSKLDRGKLNKLNVARLCEEILNPPVPMALRLSSILMGGVVILFEKKVMILHEDANRLQVELKKAWKAEVIEEPTLLPKHKAKAGRKTITLNEIEDSDVGEPEDEETSMGFQQNPFNMLTTRISPYSIHFSLIQKLIINSKGNRFDEGGQEMQQDIPLEEHIQIPTTPIPSPAREDGPRGAKDVRGQNPDQFDQHDLKKAAWDKQRQGPVKRKARTKGITIDEEQRVIPDRRYRCWLRDTSDVVRDTPDIVSGTSRRKKGHRNILSVLKIAKLMELPSTVLMDDMFGKGIQEIPYPPELLELWKKSTQPHLGSTSVRTSQPQPPHMEPAAPPPERAQNDYPMDYPFEDLHGGVGSPSHSDTKELQRTSTLKKVMVKSEETDHIASPGHSAMKRLMVKPVATSPFFTPGNSGDALRKTRSSVSGDGVPVSGDAVPTSHSEVNIGSVGSKKKNVSSSSRNSAGNPDPVVEVFHEADTDFKLSRPQQKNLKPDQELLVETQLTMEAPQNDPPDKMTEKIRKQMKTYFETPGAPRVESLSNLTAGLNRKGAAQLFYQTCVLASQDMLKVEQKEPFGDILISKGPKT